VRQTVGPGLATVCGIWARRELRKAPRMMAGADAAALEAELKRLRGDNAFLAEELCSAGQEVFELHDRLRRAAPLEGAVGFGHPGAYVDSLKLQNPRARLAEWQPVLRRYNFVLEAPDDGDDGGGGGGGGAGGGGGSPRQAKYKVRTSFSCLDKAELRGWGALPAPVGTEAAARGMNAGDAGDCAPTMGYYEVVLPPPKDAGQRKKIKTDFARFSYTDWALSKVADALPGTTLDIGTVIKWIGEAEPRTPDDALPLLTLCKDALKNIAKAQLDFRTSRETDLEKQVKELLEQRDEARTRADGLHAQCEHLQQMLKRFEVQTTQMQERLDAMASESNAKVLQSMLDAESLKRKQLEVEVASLRGSVGKLVDKMTDAEERAKEKVEGFRKELNVPITEKVTKMTEDELLQHILFVFTQPIPWDRLGPELVAAGTEPVQLHQFCKRILERLKSSAQSWVVELCALLGMEPKDFPLTLTKWYEAEGLLKLTPQLNKDIKDLARNVRKKDFNMIWDVLRQALEAKTMTMESLVFHISGKSKDDVMEEWTGKGKDEIKAFVDNSKDFSRWLARKDKDAWRHQRRHDRVSYMSFLDLSAVKSLDAKPPPTSQLNTTIMCILQLKRQWDVMCRRVGRPPLNLMRVTRAYFFHAYGIRSAAEQHLAEFLSGILLHQRRLARKEAKGETAKNNGDQPAAASEQGDAVNAKDATGEEEHGGLGEESGSSEVEPFHVSYRALLFSSLLSLDDTSKWREQATQVVLELMVQVQEMVVRLRQVLQKREGLDESAEGYIHKDSTLVQVFGDCDMLLPAAEIISIVQSEAIAQKLPEEARNIANCLRLSAEIAVPKFQRAQSMRGQDAKKELLSDEDKAAFDEAEEKRLQNHQLGLKYIVASGATGCVWIDHFLYLFAGHWHKTNAAAESARKALFAKFAQDEVLRRV